MVEIHPDIKRFVKTITKLTACYYPRVFISVDHDITKEVHSLILGDKINGKESVSDLVALIEEHFGEDIFEPNDVDTGEIIHQPDRHMAFYPETGRLKLLKTDPFIKGPNKEANLQVLEKLAIEKHKALYEQVSDNILPLLAELPKSDTPITIQFNEQTGEVFITAEEKDFDDLGIEILSIFDPETKGHIGGYDEDLSGERIVKITFNVKNFVNPENMRKLALLKLFHEEIETSISSILESIPGAYKPKMYYLPNTGEIGLTTYVNTPPEFERLIKKISEITGKKIEITDDEEGKVATFNISDFSTPAMIFRLKELSERGLGNDGPSRG